MDTVTLYMNNGSTWKYELINNTKTYLYVQDQLDGRTLRLDKDTNKLHSYDVYNSTWKYMKNTSEMLHRVEINKNEEKLG